MKDGKRILNVEVQIIPDADPDTSYLDQPEFEDRKQAYESGDFGFVGIRARAQVQAEKFGSIQTITSAGLWGIEDDSGRAYLAEVAGEELRDLRATLLAMGFSRRAVSLACKGVTL